MAPTTIRSRHPSSEPASGGAGAHQPGRTAQERSSRRRTASPLRRRSAASRQRGSVGRHEVGVDQRWRCQGMALCVSASSRSAHAPRRHRPRPLPQAVREQRLRGRPSEYTVATAGERNPSRRWAPVSPPTPHRPKEVLVRMPPPRVVGGVEACRGEAGSCADDVGLDPPVEEQARPVQRPSATVDQEVSLPLQLLEHGLDRPKGRPAALSDGPVALPDGPGIAQEREGDALPARAVGAEGTVGRAGLRGGRATSTDVHHGVRPSQVDVACGVCEVRASTAQDLRCGVRDVPRHDEDGPSNNGTVAAVAVLSRSRRTTSYRCRDPVGRTTHQAGPVGRRGLPRRPPSSRRWSCTASGQPSTAPVRSSRDNVQEN